MKVIITSEYIINILEIFNYISDDSIRYAKETINNIYSKTIFLKDFPYIGRYVPEQKGRMYREIFYKNYRVIYIVSKDIVYIISIIHNKRNFKSNFNSNVNSQF